MRKIYNISPLIIFISGCLIWSKSSNNNYLILIGNGLFLVLLVGLLSLLLAIPIYIYKRKNEKKFAQEIVDHTNSVDPISFYSVYGKYFFFTGLIIISALIYLVRFR